MQAANGPDVMVGPPAQQATSLAGDSMTRTLEQEGVRLSGHCLHAFAGLTAEAQTVILKTLLSKLREGVGDQVGHASVTAALFRSAPVPALHSCRIRQTCWFAVIHCV
jgi:ATP-dependent protease HslVU (ClpYQ) peptidase subunit